MDLELRHLQAIAAIGDNGSISAAAVALHIAQPALSRTLSQLENRLGTRLVRRTRRRSVKRWNTLPTMPAIPACITRDHRFNLEIVNIDPPTHVGRCHPPRWPGCGTYCATTILAPLCKCAVQKCE